MNALQSATMVLGCICAFSVPANAQSIDAEIPRHITVVGTGAVSMTPDILRVNLVVQSEAPEASGAIRQMSAELDNVLETLEGSGLEARDIQTAGLRLAPRHTAKRDGAEQPDLAGFIAASDMTLVIRDISRAGRILDAVVDAGATHIAGLQFDVSERGPLLEQARNAAVADAIAKTALFAQAATLRTGAIVSIEENQAGNGFPRAFSGAAARDVPLALGAFEVSAQVTIITSVE